MLLSPKGRAGPKGESHKELKVGEQLLSQSSAALAPGTKGGPKSTCNVFIGTTTYVVSETIKRLSF